LDNIIVAITRGVGVLFRMGWLSHLTQVLWCSEEETWEGY